MGHHQVDQNRQHRNPRRKKQGAGRTFKERKSGNLPNLMNDMNINIQSVTNSKISKRLTQDIIIKLSKDKKILKAAKEKLFIIYKGSSIRESADFSSEKLEARGSGLTYKMLRGK